MEWGGGAKGRKSMSTFDWMKERLKVQKNVDVYEIARERGLWRKNNQWP